MIKNILNIVGWLGTALVVAAVGIRIGKPEWDQYATYGAWAGLVCVLLYTAGQPGGVYKDVTSAWKASPG